MKLRLLILLLLFSCQKDDDGYTTYTVKAGKHYSKGTKVWVSKHSIQVWFQMDESWIKSDRNCWDKVFGIAFGDHRENSCRLGHMFTDRHIFGMYVYCDGERICFPIDTLEIGTYYVDIGHCGDRYELTLNGKTWTAPAGKQKDFNYLCKPYVGGEETIDHDWIVKLKIM